MRRSGNVTGFKRARLLFVLLLLTVGGSALMAPASAMAAACTSGTTSWTNASGGSWDDAANWSNGTPSPDCSASITLAGTYTVVTNGDLSAGLTLGGTSGTQTLQEVGTTLNGNPQDANLSLGYGGASFTIGTHGVFQMTSTGSNPGQVIVGANIVNSGLITVDAGAPGANTDRVISSNVTNNVGGVIVFHTDVNTCGCGAGGTWVNNGSFTTDAGTTSTFSRTGAGISFTQSGGTFANNGQIVVDGTLTHSGGGTTGNPIQVCGTLDPTGPGTASFILNCDGDTIGSDIGSGDTVAMVNPTSSTFDDSAGTFTNHGTLSVDSSAGALLQLHGTGNPHVLTNDGTLNFTGSNVSIGLVNNGTTNVLAATGVTTNFSTPITQAAGTLNVPGTLNADGGATLSGGTITNPGTLNASNCCSDAFTHTGGNLTGNPIQVGCGGIDVPGPGTASVVFTASDCNGGTIDSDIGSGDTVEIRITVPQLDISAASFTNHGTLSVDSSTGHLIQLHGTGNGATLTNQGTLNFTGTNVSIGLLNNGTTNVRAATGLSTNFDSRYGPITQAAGSLNVPGSLGTGVLNISGGSTTVDGTLNVTNNLPLTGGTLQGAGTIIDPSGVTNSGGTVHPGHSPGILSITGDYTQSVGGTLAVDVAGASPGTGYSQLAVSGNASLAGTLHVTTARPQTGALRVLTASVVSGTFSPVDFTGQRDSLVYDATGVQLNATAPPVAIARPVVSGSPTVGSTLSSTHGSFSGHPTSFSYQWRHCNAAGRGCSNIAGATSSNYRVAGSDVGHTLLVVVTATSAAGSGSAESRPTAVVPATGTAPVLSHVHLGSGKFTAKAGTTLALDLSERATLTVTVYHRVSGRVVHKRCRAGAKHGRRCSLTVVVRKLTLKVTAGHNLLHLHFAGLEPGHYTMAVVARAAGRRSHAITLSFVVKKPKK